MISDKQGAAESSASTKSWEEDDTLELAVQARPSSAALAKLRVSRAARQRKAHALPTCYPAPKPAAMLVAQRTTDRAQQVQVRAAKVMHKTSTCEPLKCAKHTVGTPVYYRLLFVQDMEQQKWLVAQFKY